MQGLRMRTMFLTSLLVVCFGLTAVSLLVIRINVERQIHEELTFDFQHSARTFENLELKQREMLTHETALLADLPSLKALMTTHDQKTIADGSMEFWKVSGSDLFALTDPRGKVISYSNHGDTLEPSAVARTLQNCVDKATGAQIVSISGRIYDVSVEPLYFGTPKDGTKLGYVALGYAINQQVAKEVSDAGAAQVIFSSGGSVVVSTLAPNTENELRLHNVGLLQRPLQSVDLQLGKEHYLATSVRLSQADVVNESEVVQLVVLKSYDQASMFLRKVNRLVALIGLLVFVAAALLAVYISRIVTRPLENLVQGARALGSGDFHYQLNHNGTQEVRELSLAFDRMRVQMRRTQKDLLDSERLATIGRMASSISHDLRHHLSAVYANAEFLSLVTTRQSEREELLLEVKSAVYGMTDLIDSLLVFSQTGNALHPRYDSISSVVEHAANLIRPHPDAMGVKISLAQMEPAEAFVDSRKLNRAIFNLLLNAVQAAKRNIVAPAVILSVSIEDETICIRIVDNGPGIPPSIRKTIFQPFVSEGKESGTGLGLTVALHIVQEHGGELIVEGSAPGKTVFAILLPKRALELLDPASRNSSGSRIANQSFTDSFQV
jgi:signal transduction histidine kinase